VVAAAAIMIMTVEAATPSSPSSSLLTLPRKHLQATAMTLTLNVGFHALTLPPTTSTNKTLDGGYQNYVALWYQSLMYQQQQGGQGSPAGAPAPGSS
jgi:hypothetical protein